MNQVSLFDADSAGTDRQALRFAPDFEGWQRAARQALAKGLSPDSVWWLPDRSAPPADAAPATARVPKAFVDLARSASCHSAEDRWALLYSLLWRLTRGERHVLQLSGDPEVARASDYAKAVRRDTHKMKAFVRFRECSLSAEDAAALQEAGPALRYVAWFEPSHYIVEYTAGFFRRRFAGMRWSILTPVGCAHWEGSEAAGGLWFSAPVDRSAAPSGDALEDAWRVYYRSIFNPARVKLQAMRAEMPQKYWKNMPEAHLIPQLVREADQRVAGMQAQRKQADLSQCGPRPASPAALLADAANHEQDALTRLALRAQACRNCDIGHSATQAVFGEGPADARLMIVGEQPGDQEDLSGRPFVGPAGQLLDQALNEAGLSRQACYVTNAVKHFKFEPRGRRRIHARPGAREIRACLPWVEAELAHVDPTVVICLGATAARAMLGRPLRLDRERGRWIDQAGRRFLLTVHPAYLLRLPDQTRRQAEYDRFVGELAMAAEAG